MQTVFKKLLGTTCGRVFNIFNKIKNLPLRRNDENLKRCNRFEHALASLAVKNLKLSWNAPLKDALLEGEAVKKKAILNLLNKTMSAHKRMFMHWHEFAVTQRHLIKCRMTIDFFEHLKSTL